MKYILSVIVYLTLVSTAIGQLRIDKVIPPSFNSTALIKYCDHPVGLPYGIPKIKYPIRTLINDDLFIPISLNYHAIGIKVEEEATWTGLGWYLEAGGVITRIIRGENDLGLVDEIEGTKAKGYPFEHIKPCFEDCEDNESNEFHDGVCKGEIDSDPDIFFFNILGMKGKFFLTPDQDPNVTSISLDIISPRNMKVTYYLKGNYWEVIEERGFKYLFKTREITTNHNYYLDYQLETNNSHFDHQQHVATTSWYLDEITSPKGAKATFKYDVGVDGNSPYISESAYQKMNINDKDIWDVHYSSYCFPDEMENVQVSSMNLHKDIYLQSIQSGEYEVSFHKSEETGISSIPSKRGRLITDQAIGFGRQQLDQIVVKQNGAIITTNDFYYSHHKYEKEEEYPFLYLRLKLDSLTTLQNNEKNSVAFDYDTQHSLPSKESHSRDAWGFYNGQDDPHNITPSDFYNYSQPEKMLQEEGKLKHYSLPHLQAAVLNKIKYSGGRTTEYFYDHQEFHSISEEITGHFTDKMQNSNFTHHIKPFIFGGLRIKEIREQYPKKSLYKDFKYIFSGQDSGQLIISEYSHEHHGFGHNTSGNHTVEYQNVEIKSGVLFNGHKF